MTDTEIAALQEAWARFAAWLAEHAQASHETLRPPATTEQIAGLEAALGFALLPELRALLERHNGSERSMLGFFLPLRHRLRTVSEIADMHLMLVDYRAENLAEEVWEDEEYMMGHPHQWVVFAESIDGGFAFVDHRPGPTYGAVYEFGMGSGASETSDWAPSLTALFAALADSVETGQPFRYFWPVEEESDSGQRVLGWNLRG